MFHETFPDYPLLLSTPSCFIIILHNLPLNYLQPGLIIQICFFWQHVLHLRVCNMCSILGLTPSLQNQNLHFIKIPSDFHAHKSLGNITGLYHPSLYLCRSHIPDYIVKYYTWGTISISYISSALKHKHVHIYTHHTLKHIKQSTTMCWTHSRRI